MEGGLAGWITRVEKFGWGSALASMWMILWHLTPQALLQTNTRPFRDLVESVVWWVRTVLVAKGDQHHIGKVIRLCLVSVHVNLLSLGGHFSHYSATCSCAFAVLDLFKHAALCSLMLYKSGFRRVPVGKQGHSWGVGVASGCEQLSCRLEAQIRMEIGGSGWLGFALNAYLLQKASKIQLHSQICFLFFCRGTNIDGTCCAKHWLYSRSEEDLVSKSYSQKETFRNHQKNCVLLTVFHIPISRKKNVIAICSNL